MLLSSSFVAAQDDTRAQLEQVIIQNLETLNNEDLDGHALTIHIDSLSYEETLSQMRQIFDVYDLSYRFDPDWIYIGEDDTYAYARVTSTTKKIEGPEFRDNEIEQIWVFKRFEGEWRVWTSQLLELNFLD